MYIGASLLVVEDWTIVSRLLESNADSRVRGLGLLCCLGDNFIGLKTLRALLEAYRLGAGTLGSRTGCHKEPSWAHWEATMTPSCIA